METLALINPFAPDTFPMVLRLMTVAVVVNVSCALVGSFLVLRRMSMMGDALSHAVLPGLVIAFLFSGSLGIGPMFIGAVVAGMATTYLTQTLHNYGRLTTDAAMGVVFTSLFALGVVFLKLFASHVHLDAACVYEGSLLKVLETIEIGGLQLPRQLLIAVPVLVVSVGVIGLLWKELKLTTFDASLATAMGISAPVVHYTLMTLVALTAVASFQVVGSILVIAMLIIPPATAQLCVERLSHMVWLSCLLGAAVAVCGSVTAVYFDVSPPGTMAVYAGLFYAMAMVFSPTNGVLSRAWFHYQTASRIVREDLLAMVYRVEELDNTRHLKRESAVEAVGGGLVARRALQSLLSGGEMTDGPEGIALTELGRGQAATMVRTHRLWETYLVEELNLPLDHVHEPAHRMEHFIDDEIREQLAERLPEGAEDPHGREIPEP
ncbi:metal ABC transporter permease [Aeoliella mucimassa]|uniref:Manganese transport system membrane protein MntB n=1 Tax=Aeoliella mucimassa TaxID=2527972 RepID=A0A518AQ02_9BACT|nr:iron chelate uptake ABC transporter family permease subunit [Aeoliella mucimassa]QDU56799.1 Manganese transport system membrane protein MntB [Aeoliella mucimassa]